jgi:NAD(P)H-quinone oxidoreductase subunit 5
MSKTVGPLPDTATASPRVPAVLTWLVWLLWAGSLGVLVAYLRAGGPWELAGILAVDGLTVLLWVVVTFFSGIVHSYSRRYMAGSSGIERFFTRVFGFTLVVMALVAAAHLALFVLAWLAMGLVMADLIGYAREWPQAQAAGRVARRYFLASSLLLAAGVGRLWLATDATTVTGVATAAGEYSWTVWLPAAVAIVLAALVQSAIIPFHTWLISSMTAPTPASALMHAGFVNAGGILLARFAPLVTLDPALLGLIALVGATSAILGKLLKSIQPTVKTQLGCSTVGQMGFMVMQAGLGFFGAAIAHLVLHGFYKAYLFLASGERVEHTSPSTHARPTPGVAGAVVTLLTAVAGGVVFALLTGKGTKFDSGLLLTVIVVMTTLHATQTVVQRTEVPASVRYGVVALVFLPSIALYAGVYTAVTAVMDLPVVTAPAELTAVHGIVVAGFLSSYAAIEYGVFGRNERVYATLMNLVEPPAATLLTSREEYNEY